MYIVLQDYDRLIQLDNLSQVIASDSAKRRKAEVAAQEQVLESLVQKYDIRSELTDTNPFDIGLYYTGGSRIILDFAAYNPLVQYLAVNKACVIFDGLAYIVKNDSANPAGTFVSSDWTLLGTQYDIFYVPYPYPLFNFNTGVYKVGDRTFWRGKIYQSLQSTGISNQQTRLQNINQNDVPPGNVFPDDPYAGPAFWGVGVDYSFKGYVPGDSNSFTAWSAITTYAAGDRSSYAAALGSINVESLTSSNLNKIPLSDITNWQQISWVLGDNRSHSLVMYVVDITLYHLHARISPRNIPELRASRYDAAKKWLEDAAHGIITPSLPQNQPQTGSRIQWGGKTPLESTY